MRHSPFTELCRRLAVIRDMGRADLHVHTHYSDGTHSPESLVERAIKAGLKAVAVTDHDTADGVPRTTEAARGRLEIVAGVEVTAEFRGSEIHLLGYFIRLDDEPLNAALRELRAARRVRLLEMSRRLGLGVEDDAAAMPEHVSLGRRHLARILMARGHARSLHDAFTRLLSHPHIADVSKRRLPAADAIGLIRGAGGVTSWAHPPVEVETEVMTALRVKGLQAIECVYPWPTRTHERRLRAMAESLGLAVTGGSDSHDPTPPTRAIGARTVTIDEFEKLRLLAAASAN
jgi:hypothetical protein